MTNLMTPQEKYQIVKDAYTAARADMIKQTQDSVRELAQDLFSKYSTLDSFSWVQYTPYFNDGEECHFQVISDLGYITISGSDDWPEDPTERSPWRDVSQAVEYLIDGFDSDMLRDIYGDHAKVTINRNGTATVEEYDHE